MTDTFVNSTLLYINKLFVRSIYYKIPDPGFR